MANTFDNPESREQVIRAGLKAQKETLNDKKNLYKQIQNDLKGETGNSQGMSQ